MSDTWQGIAGPVAGLRALWRRHWFRRTVKASAGIVAAAAIAHAVALTCLEYQVSAAMADLRARGEPLAIRSACAPLRVHCRENAATLYMAAAALIADDLPYRPVPPKDDEALDRARTAVARDRLALRLVAEATQRPRCQFDVNWEAGSMALLDHYSVMSLLTRMVSCAAVVAAREQRLDEAYDYVLAGLRVSNHVGTEPIPDSQLASHAMDGTVARAAAFVFVHGAPGPAVQQALLEALVDRDFRGDFVRSLKGHRALGLHFLSQECYTREGQYRICHDCGRIGRLYGAWLTRAILRRVNQLNYLRVMERAIQNGTQPVRYGCPEAMERESLPWHCFVAKWLVPGPWLKVWRDRALARRGLLQTAMGLEVHRAEHGRYPETLGELRSDTKWAVPADVFSGKDFVYQRKGSTFLLYSLGPDLDDDRGRPDWVQKPRYTGEDGRRLSGEGDIVWISHGQKEAFRQRWVSQPPGKPSYVDPILLSVSPYPDI